MVDGMIYRWVVSPTSGYMDVVVMQANAGRRLILRCGYEDLVALDGTMRQQRSIGSGVIRRGILAARSAGWDPGDANPAPFVLEIGS